MLRPLGEGEDTDMEAEEGTPTEDATPAVGDPRDRTCPSKHTNTARTQHVHTQKSCTNRHTQVQIHTQEGKAHVSCVGRQPTPRETSWPVRSQSPRALETLCHFRVTEVALPRLTWDTGLREGEYAPVGCVDEYSGAASGHLH